MTIFAIIEQTYSVIAFAQVNPFVRTGFKARPVPTGIAVGWPFNITPLNLIRGCGAQHSNREGDFQQDMPFFPVNGCVEINLGTAMDK